MRGSNSPTLARGPRVDVWEEEENKGEGRRSWSRLYANSCRARRVGVTPLPRQCMWCGSSVPRHRHARSPHPATSHALARQRPPAAPRRGQKGHMVQIKFGIFFIFSLQKVKKICGSKGFVVVCVGGWVWVWGGIAECELGS